MRLGHFESHGIVSITERDAKLPRYEFVTFVDPHVLAGLDGLDVLRMSGVSSNTY